MSHHANHKINTSAPGYPLGMLDNPLNETMNHSICITIDVLLQPMMSLGLEKCARKAWLQLPLSVSREPSCMSSTAPPWLLENPSVMADDSHPQYYKHLHGWWRHNVKSISSAMGIMKLCAE